MQEPLRHPIKETGLVTFAHLSLLYYFYQYSSQFINRKGCYVAGGAKTCDDFICIKGPLTCPQESEMNLPMIIEGNMN